MNVARLAEELEQYRLALEAELALLRQLQEVAAHQRAVTHEQDLAALQRASDERERLMAGLLAIEQQVSQVREHLAQERAETRRLPAFAGVLALHKTVTGIVAEILESDRDSIRALEQVVAARRLAAQTVEHGESTLAAYGRVATPPPQAALVSKRG